MQTHSLRRAIPASLNICFALLAIALVMLACSAGPAVSEETDRESATNPQTPPSLAEALEEHGAIVGRTDEVDQPFFSVPGVILSVDGEDVQVFEYESERARRDESELISDDGRTIGTQSVHWIGNPRFWAHDRLLVLYLGENEDVIAHLSALLGSPIAGPSSRTLESQNLS